MSVKRGVIQFNGATEKIRISVPGVDVDAATTTQFLMHEAILYSQPYFSAFVTCPFAGNTGTSALNQNVDVTVPDVTSDPIMMCWVADSGGSISFPVPKATGSGSAGAGYDIDSYFVSTIMLNSTTARVNFVKPSNSHRSPNGAYLILMRKPDL